MPKEFKLEITFNPATKDCKVTGPINEPELCYLGLEIARRTIQGYNKKRIIVGPSATPFQKIALTDFKKLLKNGG